MSRLMSYTCFTLFVLLIVGVNLGCSQAVANEQVSQSSTDVPGSPQVVGTLTVTPNATQLLGPTLDAQKDKFFESLYGDQEPPSAEEAQTPYLTRQDRISPTPFTPEPTTTFVTGITRDCWEVYPHVLVPRNCLTEQVDDRYIIVYAGARKNMPEQGLLIMESISLDGTLGTPARFYYTPTQNGWIEIEDIVGHIVHLIAQDGSRFVFDTSIHNWIVPTATPTP